MKLFFSRLESDPVFKDNFVGYYDSMRCMFHRTTDSILPIAPVLDVALVKKAELMLQNEIRLEEACKSEWMVRKERVEYLLATKKSGWLGQLVGLESDLPRLPKRITAWIPRYQPRLIPESQVNPTVVSGEPVGQRKRPFGRDESVEKQVAKRRRAGTGERSDCHLMTTKVRRSSSRTVWMVPTPEKFLSPVKRELVKRVQSRRRSITPFPADAPNQIVARVLTEETEHPSLGWVTRASE